MALHENRQKFGTEDGMHIDSNLVLGRSGRGNGNRQVRSAGSPWTQLCFYSPPF